VTQPREIDDVIAAQIRQYRLLKGWSVKRLAEECERLGAAQLTSSSLGNIERGQDPEAKRARRRVGVAELLVLATALDVPPVALMVPFDGSQVAITPQLSMSSMDAVTWFEGKWQPGHTLPLVAFVRAAAPINMYSRIANFLWLAVHQERSADQARRAGEDAAAETAIQERATVGRHHDNP
jgi:transcriptional regulator with XRE-family HTH domain